MIVEMAIRVTYDRDKDGGLKAFRDKYRSMKAHIEKMQANGSMPRCEITWEMRAVPPPPTPAKVIYGPWVHQPEVERIQPFFMPVIRPEIAHEQGTPLRVVSRMDMKRLAM